MFPLNLNFVKSEAMFAFSSYKVWNALLLNIKKSDSVSIFKSKLKTHFFNLVFDVFCLFIYLLNLGSVYFAMFNKILIDNFLKISYGYRCKPINRHA